MSRLWPHTPNEEDQPYPHLILTTHVFTRAAQAGSLVGIGLGSGALLVRQFRKLPSATLATTIVRSAGVGSVIGIGILAAGLPIRMWGRERIEWQDRSWRLLENKGQLECDDWTYPGMALGFAAVAGNTRRMLGWRGAVGGAGLGGVAGMMGYLGWRYGVKGGKFDDESEE